MALQVVGAGLGRTGTMSLKLALTRLLGAPCYHMVEVFSRPAHYGLWAAAGRGEPVDWDALFDGFVAAVDWPAASLWEDLSHKYPDAIILLSTRDSASWWKSASETIFSTKAPPGTPMADMLDSLFSRYFTSDRMDRDAAIAAYERHNAYVRTTAPPARLVDWTMKDGWEPLCTALRLPVPDEPFPHANTTDEFKARVAASGGVRPDGSGPPGGGGPPR